MWKQLWKTWTLDKPTAFGDWLWDVFVVQLAAFLDRLTLRRVAAFIPVLILLWAYAHSVPIHPGLLLVGDVLAYIDIFSMILLFSFLTRAATVLFVLKQAAASVAGLANGLFARMQRLDVRHRREAGAKKRRGAAGRAGNEDDDPAGIQGVAWA